MRTNKPTIDDVISELLESYPMEEVVKKIEELDIDLDVPLKQSIKNLGKESYDVNVNNKEYELTYESFMLENNKIFSEINFRLKNLKKIKNLQKSNSQLETGITQTGDSLKVFSKIVSTVLKLVKQKLPDYITFQARENDRQKLYNHIIKRINKYITEYKQINISPLTNEKIESDEFWLEKIN